MALDGQTRAVIFHRLWGLFISKSCCVSQAVLLTSAVQDVIPYQSRPSCSAIRCPNSLPNLVPHPIPLGPQVSLRSSQLWWFLRLSWILMTVMPLDRNYLMFISSLDWDYGFGGKSQRCIGFLSHPTQVSALHRAPCSWSQLHHPAEETLSGVATVKSLWSANSQTLVTVLSCASYCFSCKWLHFSVSFGPGTIRGQAPGYDCDLLWPSGDFLLWLANPILLSLVDFEFFFAISPGCHSLSLCFLLGSEH
jgi:hypothetical protein